MGCFLVMWNLITSLPRRWSFLFSWCDLIHVTWYYRSKSRCFRTSFLSRNISAGKNVNFQLLFMICPRCVSPLFLVCCGVGVVQYLFNIFMMWHVFGGRTIRNTWKSCYGEPGTNAGNGKMKNNNKRLSRSSFPCPLSTLPVACCHQQPLKKKNSHVCPFLSWTTCRNL